MHGTPPKRIYLKKRIKRQPPSSPPKCFFFFTPYACSTKIAFTALSSEAHRMTEIICRQAQNVRVNLQSHWTVLQPVHWTVLQHRMLDSIEHSLLNLPITMYWAEFVPSLEQDVTSNTLIMSERAQSFVVHILPLQGHHLVIYRCYSDPLDFPGQ